MAGRHKQHAAGDAETLVQDGAWLVLVEDRGVLDFPPAPVADRCLRALRRVAGATAVAVSLRDESRRLLRYATDRDGWAPRAELLPASQSLEPVLRERGTPRTEAAPYTEAAVTLDGVVVGHVAVAGAEGAEPADDAPDVVADVAAAVSTHLELQLAESQTHRVRQ